MTHTGSVLGNAGQNVGNLDRALYYLDLVYLGFQLTLFHESLINLLEGNFHNPNDHLHTGSLKKKFQVRTKMKSWCLKGIVQDC